MRQGWCVGVGVGNNKWDLGKVGRTLTVFSTEFISLSEETWKFMHSERLRKYFAQGHPPTKQQSLGTNPNRFDTTVHVHSPLPNVPLPLEHQPYIQKHILYVDTQTFPSFLRQKTVRICHETLHFGACRRTLSNRNIMRATYVV